VRAYRPKPRDEVARNMAAIRSTENKTEVALRSELHKLGLRFRKYPPNVTGKPDFVFPSKRVAVFVDGDYWHGRRLLETGSAALAKTLRERPNVDYWLTKFTRNAQRDEEVSADLVASGWLVIRLWESDVKKNVPVFAERIYRLLQKRTGRLRNGLIRWPSRKANR